MISKIFTTTTSQKFSQLKQTLGKIIPQRRKSVLQLKKAVGSKVVGSIKADQLFGGMRQMPALYYQGSQLHPMNGIRIRGMAIPELKQKCQKVQGGKQPLPQSVLYLLLTNKIPTDAQLKGVQQQLKTHYVLTQDQKLFLNSLPKKMHPMTQLSMCLMYQQKDSRFMSAYSDQQMKKTDYWSFYYDDAMNLLSKIPTWAAAIYRKKYHDGKYINPDANLDWAGNYAHMMGFDKKQMMQCIRGYLSIHSDHQGGNVSAHTCHLVSSALADPFLSYSAALNGLAGPLHGLANQQCLKFLLQLKQFHKGKKPDPKIVQEFTNKTLNSGQVIPGYGHAVLRNTDPRFVHQKQFAQENIKGDQLCELIGVCYNVIPQILKKLGKVKNPWPNVDCHSGALLYHYGLRQFEYYTVVFGVSRALGCMANAVWSRALGLPIQRPGSLDFQSLNKLKE